MLPRTVSTDVRLRDLLRDHCSTVANWIHSRQCAEAISTTFPTSSTTRSSSSLCSAG